jgi:hypothetical protein
MRQRWERRDKWMGIRAGKDGGVALYGGCAGDLVRFAEMVGEIGA